MSTVRVLYLQRTGETSPPPNVSSASTNLRVHPAGTEPDQSVLEFGPQVVVISGPFDFDCRTAIDRVLSLQVPVIGIGKGTMDLLATSVSSLISSRDLSAMLDVSVQLHACENPIALEQGAHGDPERMTEDIVRMLERMMGLRIPGYKERATRIFDTCLWIGNHLCLPPKELKELTFAARLREIGKLGLPDKLLFSQRKHRTTEDQLLYDQYCDHGQAVLSEYKPLRGCARLIGLMLENFDGTGPGRLHAVQIPLGSRILRVAAAFEMILVDNQFKIGTSQVMDVLQQKTGSLYDPMLVKLIETYHDLVHGKESRRQSLATKVTDLAVGMVLAQDIWSRTGMKIISKGTRLTEHTLKILRQYPLDPSQEFVEVKVQ